MLSLLSIIPHPNLTFQLESRLFVISQAGYTWEEIVARKVANSCQLIMSRAYKVWCHRNRLGLGFSVRERVRVTFKVSLLAVYYGRWPYRIDLDSKLDIAHRDRRTVPQFWRNTAKNYIATMKHGVLTIAALYCVWQMAMSAL